MNSPQTEASFGRKMALVVGLFIMAGIHLLDLPGKWSETRYIAFLYIGLILASFILSERILSGATKLDYLAAALLAASVFVSFVINRTVGLPGAKGDIGNWLEPLGFLTLFVHPWTSYQAFRCYLAANSAAK